MRRCKLTEVEGAEMLAFSEAFYFLNDLKIHIEGEITIQQIQAQQYEQQIQAMSNAIAMDSPFLEETENNPNPVEKKVKKKNG